VTPVIYTTQARAELAKIWRDIADENEPAADRIFLAITERVEALRHYPRIGPRRPDIRPTTRLLVEGNYLILYELHPDRDDEPVEWVEVVTIVDGRRDLTEFF
jgi:toxin ParE1/3/4